MNSGKIYKTKQREAILNCLRENKDKHVTVEMIISYLKSGGNSVGQTTVYRTLDKLVADGILIKYATLNGISTCYQYLEQSENNAMHCHLVCVKCGQLIHLDCSYVDELSIHIQKEHHFSLDNLKTVLYGCCENCSALK